MRKPLSTLPVSLMLVLGLVLVLGLSVSADDKKKAPIEGTLTNEKSVAVLKLKGSVSKWPDHSFAYVKVFVKDGPDLDWYKMEVTNGAFDGAFAFGARKTAPMVYRAELWLRVGLQSAGVKAWFQKEFGVGKDHAEVVDACDLSSGTAAEQKAYRKTTVDKCSSWLARVKALSEKATTAIDSAKAADWDKARKKLEEEATKIQEDYLAYEKEWVTLGKEALRLKEIKDVVVAIFKILEEAATDADAAREASEQAKAGVEKAAASLETTKHELEDKK